MEITQAATIFAECSFKKGLLSVKLHYTTAALCVTGKVRLGN